MGGLFLLTFRSEKMISRHTRRLGAVLQYREIHERDMRGDERERQGLRPAPLMLQQLRRRRQTVLREALLDVRQALLLRLL